MPFTEEDKILINNLFDFKGYNGKHIIREFSSKGWNVGLVYQLLQKLWVSGFVDLVPTAADDAARAQLINIVLLRNWCYTKMAW